jgi:hypothetical protein
MGKFVYWKFPVQKHIMKRESALSVHPNIFSNRNRSTQPGSVTINCVIIFYYENLLHLLGEGGCQRRMKHPDRECLTWTLGCRLCEKASLQVASLSLQSACASSPQLASPSLPLKARLFCHSGDSVTL